MSRWLYTIYSIYALVIFAIILIFGLIAYIFVKLIIPYRKQINGVYVINRIMMTIWSPLVFLRYRVSGEEVVKRNQTYIVVMNHQSILDMFACARKLIVPGKPLIKRELLSVPLLGWLFSMAGIPVDRSDAESRARSFSRMEDEVQKGISILIFPEGTRNKSSKPLSDFKPGAFKLSKSTGIPVLPVVLMNIRSQGQAKSALFKPGAIHMRYLDPVNPAEIPGGPEDLMAYCHDVMERSILDYDPEFQTK